MTSKQRAYLRGLANTMDPVLHIGKEGITQGVVQQAWDALEAREMIKVALMRYAPYETAQEACAALCEKTHAEPVQCIGSKFVIYRRAREAPHLVEA
ncbi:MAG: YhbY family RNA-binding protein [Firmicutes bacterium]|nr:YhbY family RNA-binding protein [Bacillota bacterium]